VHNKGTFAQALQAECMQVWNVSISTNKFKKIKINYTINMLIADMLLFDTTNYNVSTMPKNLKVINIIFTSTIKAWIYL